MKKTVMRIGNINIRYTNCILYIFLCFWITLIFVININMKELNITGWNMHGFACGKEYLECISQTYDVVAISEHWLFPQEIDKIKKCMPEDFVCEVKCSSDLIPENCCRHIGHAGVALCWRDAPSRAKVKVNSDRICALRITSEKEVIFVIAVYLPPEYSKLDDFCHVLDELHIVVDDCSSKGDVCV